MHIKDNLIKNYSNVFDFEDEFVLGEYKFDLYAKFYQENLKYFGSKKIEVYSFTNNEHLFYKHLGNNQIDFGEIKNVLLYAYKNLVKVDDKHMSSLITLIYSVDSLKDSEKKLIKKFSFYKSYMFGLKGYVNGKLIVLDLGENKAYENKMAKGDAIKLKLLS